MNHDELTPQGKQYWRLVAAFQELIGVSDEDIALDKDLKEYIDQIARVALNFRLHGAEGMRKIKREQILANMGIRILRPRQGAVPPEEPPPSGPRGIA